MLMIPRRDYGLSLFDEMFKDPFFSSFDRAPAMKTDIQEKDGNYLLDIDLPGFDKDDIKAELKDGYLTISANKDEKKEEKDEKGNYIRRERYTGHCQRSFYVGNQVSQEDISASYKDGILKLVVPNREEKKIEDQTKYIDIH